MPCRGGQPTGKSAREIGARRDPLFALLQMYIEPGNHPIAEVQLVGVTPSQGQVVFAFILRVLSLLAEPTQVCKDLVLKKAACRPVVGALDDQARGFTSTDLTNA